MAKKVNRKADPRRTAYYARMLLNKDSWFGAADRLTEAMEALDPAIDAWQKTILASEFKSWNHRGVGCMQAFMLLGGFALENLCKGCLIVERDATTQEIAEQGQLSKHLGNHGLRKLVLATGYRASKTQLQLLETLEKIVVWRGRYPIPKSADDLSPTVETSSDPEALRRLISDVRLHVHRKTALSPIPRLATDPKKSLFPMTGK
jgi:hypothetical protein